MKKIMLLCFSILLACHTMAATSAADLFNTINDRLSYMEDVAIYKSENHLAIEDLPREAIVIGKAKQTAAESGLNPDTVEDFFRAQIAVAKAIQYRYRADYQSQPATHSARDLNTEVRPALLQLGNQIITQISQYQQHGAFQPQQYDQFKQIINVKYVTEADKKRLFDALLKIKIQ